MSKTYHKLSTGNLTQDWGNGSLITANDDWSLAPSVVGYRGDGLVGSTGVNPTTVSGDSAVVQVFANQANPNTLSSGGVAEFQLAGGDTVVALQGSGTAKAPHLVFYLDASGRQNLTFSLDLRDLDGSADNSVQQVAVQYRVGESGPWLNVTPNGYVADTSTGPSQATKVTHLDLTLPSAVDNQSQVQVRVLTTDAVGADEWVGIDNVVFSSAPMGADTTAPTLTASAPADGAVGIAPGANLVLNFSELVTIGSGKITISDGAGDTRVIDVTDASQVTLSGQSLTINPAADLKLGATYQVSLEAGTVKDMAGNTYAGTGANPIDFSTMAPLTRIYEIQGASHTSAYAGKLVNTEGVVVAIDTTGGKGFWIQDINGDGNHATSDGVFVFSSSGSAAVKVGDLVSLQGLVEEYTGNNANNLTTTEITNISGLTVLSSGNTVAATVLGANGRAIPTNAIDSDNFAVFNPDFDGIDFYESVEGMLVQVQGATVTSSTYQNATWILADGGANASNANDRGSVTRAANDSNPERIMLYSDSGVSAGTGGIFAQGDNLGTVNGVMHYYGGNYEFVMTSAVSVVSHTNIVSEVTTLKGDAAHMTVGAYNVENLDPNDSAAKWAALGQDIAVGLSAPDVLGVEEIQDSNGTGTGVLDATVTLQKLVDAIVAAGGPRYQWVVVDPAAENTTGGEPNGNIRNAILYNPERVGYVDGSAKLLADVTPANGDSFNNSRKPLAADFTFHGETVTFIGVHNYSRLGSDEAYGKNQPPVNSGDARRTDQTAAVLDYVQKLKAINPDANIVVGGDFNGYQWETAQSQLEAGGLLKNMAWTLPAWDRYSSSFQGENQQIDHLFVSSNVAGGAVFDNVHLNSNFAYGTRPTDHDAVLAKVLFNHGPQGVADVLAASEDVLLAANAAMGVLANDTDINQDALNAVLVQGPAHGTLTLNADGSYSYQAAANYNGDDSFTYLAKDAFGGQSGPVTVQIKVAAVNDAPTLEAGAASAALVEAGLAGAGTAAAAVALARVDIDSATSYDTSGWTDAGNGLWTRNGVYGSATLDTVNNTISYQLDNARAATNGLAAGAAAHDDFTVTVTDGALTASAPVSFAITGANDGPQAQGDSAAVAEDASVSIDVLANDSDVDMDALSIVLGNAKSALGASLAIVNGKVVYSADADSFDLLANGASVTDSFTYYVADGQGGNSAPVTVNVKVSEAGDARVLYGSNKADSFTDAAGKDSTYHGDNGNDSINGGDGADMLYGDNGDDVVNGGEGIDKLFGGNGNDNLAGGAGDDMLYGDNGSDFLSGGAGRNVLTGGNGADIFAIAGGALDLIADFRREDFIMTGFNGNNGAAKAAFGFADSAAGVLVTGGGLGGGSVVLQGWTVAQLVGQNMLSEGGQVQGHWIA